MLERRADVVVLPLRLVQRRRQVEGGLEPFGEGCEVGGMPVTEGLDLSRVRHPSERVLADGLEHGEARRTSRAGRRPDEALLQQRHEGREVRVTHALGGLDGPAAGEDGEPSQKGALARLEELVAPVDRGPQRALAVGKIALAAFEHSEPVLESREQRRRREDAQTCGSELQCER